VLPLLRVAYPVRRRTSWSSGHGLRPSYTNSAATEKMAAAPHPPSTAYLRSSTASSASPSAPTPSEETGTLMRAPAAAISRTSGKTIFPAGSPGTDRQQHVAGPRSPAPRAGCVSSARHLARLLLAHARTVAVLDVSLLHPAVQAALGDPEVLRDLVQRSLCPLRATATTSSRNSWG